MQASQQRGRGFGNRPPRGQSRSRAGRGRGHFGHPPGAPPRSSNDRFPQQSQWGPSTVASGTQHHSQGQREFHRGRGHGRPDQSQGPHPQSTDGGPWQRSHSAPVQSGFFRGREHWRPHRPEGASGRRPWHHRVLHHSGPERHSYLHGAPVQYKDGGPQQHFQRGRSVATAGGTRFHSQPKSRFYRESGHGRHDRPQGDYHKRGSSGSSFRSNLGGSISLFGRGATSTRKGQRTLRQNTRQPPFQTSSFALIRGHTGPSSYSKHYSCSSNFRTQQKGHWNSQAQMRPSMRTHSQPNLSYTHSHSKDSENRVRNISRNKQLDLTVLEDILKKEASEIVMILAAPDSGLKEFLNKEDHTSALTFITLEVLHKACSTQTCSQNLRHLLTTVKDSLFLNQSLPKLIMTVDGECDQGNKEQSFSKLDKIIAFNLNVLRVFPCSTFTDVSLTVVLLENEYERYQSAGHKIPEESQNWLKNLQTTIAQLQKKKCEGILMSDQDIFRQSDRIQDQNFRSLSVFPTHEDVCSDEGAYMEKINTSGKFKDSSSYLDAQFRFLRKSFMKPLRDRIAHLLKADENIASEGRVESSTLSHVYFNTSIILPVCTRRGIVYEVWFDATKLRTMNWERSKNLLVGTLVCLSKDRFETMIWATVTKRDVHQLVQGITTLSFTEESRLKLADISPSDTFTMVDSSLAFGDYCSVLEGLQEMATENLPMQKYIISCETDILTAKYLENNQNLYNLKGLIDCHFLNRGISGPEWGSIQKMGQENHKGSVSNWHLKNILNSNEWPSKEELSLDDSQLKALQDALTKELTVIQGQPGAGKTYVGLRIIRALVDNAHIWGAGVASPILIVCPNSHVLDALLEGVLQIFPDASWLVRVGRQSSSNVLNDLSLENLKKMPHFRQSLPKHLKSTHWKLCEQRMEAEERHERMTALLEHSSKGILHENVLAEYIVTLHGAGLERTKSSGLASPQMDKQNSKSLILNWLELSILTDSDNFEDQIPEETWKTEGGGNEEQEDVEETQEDDTDDVMSVDYSDIWSAGDSEEILSVASTGEQDEEVMDMLEELDLEATDFDDIDPETMYLSENEEYYYSDESGIRECDAQVGSSEDRDFFANTMTGATEQISAGDHDTERVTAMGVGTMDLDSAGRMAEGGDNQEHVQMVPHQQSAVPQRTIFAYLLWENEGEKEEGECGRSDNMEETREMKRSLETVVKQELHKVDHMPKVDARQITDLWALPLKDRWHLYRLWLSIYQKDVKAEIMALEIQYEAIVKRIDEVRLMEDERILKQAKVIGMTTAGAAQYRRLLQEIRPRVILVEEAQEVPEAHVVTTLTSACQHLILIGDQQQFRSCPAEYEQEETLHLEGSLFERLIQEGFPSVRLENQHRMHLDIGQILTPHIYNAVNKQNSVEEKIKGVTTNVFFLDHKHHEEIIHRGQGYQNLHETSFVNSLCQYLIYQGYMASQITVLTPCDGQIFCLRKCMPKSTFLGVKVCLVDEFQGRENDIIILSLVRSNMEGQVYFMKNKYVGIALSRAKKALYCIGNLAAHSALPMWNKILSAASNCRQIGEALMLRCENHPATITAVSKGEDFLKVPLGGCLQPCGSSLSCGHLCSKLCHPNWDHTCGNGCRAEGDTWPGNPPLSPEQDIPYRDLTHHCGKSLPCEHTCAYDRGHSSACCCSQEVTVELQCGHQQSVLCRVWQERKQQPIECRSRCEERLICSHQCRGKCGAPCVPCTKPCRTKCYHRRCQRSCLVACQPCPMKCGWLCSHYQCTKQCLEPCNRPPCSMPCQKLLKCQHPCIGMCGEPCPGKCRVCNADEVCELFFGNEADPEARFVQLADCRHIFEVRGFDSWMTDAQESGLIGLNVCPKCDVPIRQNLRYNRVVKSKLHELEVLKRKATDVLLAQTLDMVKEMESKGIMSSFVPPLLSTLNQLGMDIPRGVYINKQITLLLQLSEIRSKIQTTLPILLPIINYQLNMFSQKINQANGDQVLEYECQVRRIALLAEARKLYISQTCPQRSPATSAASVLEYEKLDAIINGLGMMSLQEKDVKKLEKDLNDIARKMKVPLSRIFLEETSKVAMNFGFLKLNHWSKCKSGHIYYNRAADGFTKSDICNECFQMRK